ncbi:hypothetical protein DRI50_01545 [candidate division KSB1 bacterium]|jgi:hypothetical protein|nr:MAG: hypothetical protein DRI50_01545 [candidate division KSB1 bacterium]
MQKSFLIRLPLSQCSRLYRIDYFIAKTIFLLGLIQKSAGQSTSFSEIKTEYQKKAILKKNCNVPKLFLKLSIK